MFRSLSLAAVIHALNCGAPAANDGVVWIDGESFTAPKQGFFEGLAAPLGGGEAGGVRLAAALDHNCPLDEVLVAAANEHDTSFVVSVCGEEKRYSFDGAIYVERVTRAVAPAEAAAAPTPTEVTPPNTAAPTPDSPPKGDPKQ